MSRIVWMWRHKKKPLSNAWIIQSEPDKLSAVIVKKKKSTDLQQQQANSSSIRYNCNMNAIEWILCNAKLLLVLTSFCIDWKKQMVVVESHID